MKHRPPKKNFGTLDENIDEKGEFNPWRLDNQENLKWKHYMKN